MTLPTNIILPSYKNRGDSPKEEERYQRELTFSLQRMYEELAEGINGQTRSNNDIGNRQWTPTLVDTGDTTTTFTYDHQIGNVLRKGLMTDVSFDIQWTAASAALTGNMYVSLPYKVAVASEKPFVGSVQTSGFAYTGGTGCVINAIENTYRLEVWNVGSGFTTANQGSVTSGQLIGCIRYAGQQIERN